MTRAPTDVDAEIGRAIRERRNAIGISQERLAHQLGITFQQVQKYENGRNRVAASRLLDIARALDAPVADFLPDARTQKTAPPAAGEGNRTGR